MVDKNPMWVVYYQLTFNVNFHKDFEASTHSYFFYRQTDIMVKSNVMGANDLAPLLAEDIPSHKS